MPPMALGSRIWSSSAVPRRRHMTQPSSERESAFLPREAGGIRAGKADMHGSPIPLIPSGKRRAAGTRRRFPPPQLARMLAIR